jgi:hypothetical protein
LDPIAAARTAGGYDVVLSNVGDDQYGVWQVDGNGNYVANILTSVSGTNFGLEALETSFHLDLNGDGTIGPAGMNVIQIDGSTYLTQVGSNYYLYNSSGTGPVLQFGGAPVIAGQVNGWTPIGAVQTADGYDVALRLTGTNQYSVWGTDSGGNFSSGIIGGVAGTSLALEGLELTFQQDLNGDGTVGPLGVTDVGNQIYLSLGSAPSLALKYQGAPVVVGQFGGNWTPIATVKSASGYEIAWSNVGDNQYGVWNVDSNGNYASNILSSVPGNALALEQLEPSFAQDLNGDGVIGVPTGSPVFLGLDGNGINIVPLGASTAQFDMTGNGTPVPTAWAGAGDGILAIDLGADGSLTPDGVIDQAKEIEFTTWAPGATSDMAALEQAFDTNHDGMLDAGDADWNDFRVWVGSNGVGTGQLFTLGQLGITSIDLHPTGPAQTLPDGSAIHGTSSYTLADGTTGTAGDVALAFATSPSPSNSGSTPIVLSNGVSIDAGIAQLVSAMAATPAGSGSFNTASAVAMPTDIIPPSVIAATLHP